MQDASAVVRVAEDRGLAIVADGAGSCANSAVGASRAVTAAAAVFRPVLERLDSFTAEAWRAFAVDALRRVRDTLADAAEELGVDAPSLACTTIVLAYTPTTVALVHVGDGRAAYRDASGTWKALMQPFKGSEAGETVFLTSAVWEEEVVSQYVRTNVVRDEVTGFVCMTDGCERTAFVVSEHSETLDRLHDPNRPHAAFLEPNAMALLALARDGWSSRAIDKEWHAFLREGDEALPSLRHQVDDKSMILGVYRPADREHPKLVGGPE